MLYWVHSWSDDFLTMVIRETPKTLDNCQYSGTKIHEQIYKHKTGRCSKKED